MRQLLRQVTDGQIGAELTVVALAGDRAALGLAPQMAVSAAQFGIGCTFVEVSDQKESVMLRQASVALAKPSAPARPNLRVCVDDDKPKPPGPELRIRGVVLDTCDPLQPSASRQTTTWLALTSGFATSDELAKVLGTGADRYQPIGGIVVVNPDPDDVTTGHLPLRSGDARPSEPKRIIDAVKDVTR
jgi:hypothetical protein